MKQAPYVVATILIAALVGTGIGKIKRAKPIRHNLRAVEVSRKWWNPMAAIELLLAMGLVVGLLMPPLGILAGIGVFFYFAGAVAAHLRTQDANVVPSGLFTILAGYMVKLMIDLTRERRLTSLVPWMTTADSDRYPSASSHRPPAST